MMTVDSPYCEHHFKHCQCEVLFCSTCFKWCDMESEHVCGDCQHWVRDCSNSDNGRCFFYGNVKKTQRVDCPRYRLCEKGSLTWPAWVEKTTKSIAGNDVYETDLSSPEVREARKTARALYRNNFDS